MQCVGADKKVKKKNGRPNKKPEKFMGGSIYLFWASISHKWYLGKTNRPLIDRIKEHVASMYKMKGCRSWHKLIAPTYAEFASSLKTWRVR